jgi:integrase
MQKQYYYPAGVSLTEEDFERISKAKTSELKQLREIILAGFDRIKEIIKPLVKSGDFSLEALHVRLKGDMKNSIVTAFMNKVESLKANGKIGTSEWYRYSLNSIKDYSQRDLKFAEITVNWLKKYEEHLLEKDKSYTTISMYMRALQAIINDGKRQGVISQTQYPFGKGKYEIPQEEGRKMALTLSQIKAVLDYPLLTDNEKRCRDLWFFSYLCNGINAIDLLHLKYSDIENGKISFYRIKTLTRSKKKKKITAIMLPQMQLIIDRWGNPDTSPQNFIFAYLTEGMTPEEERRIVKNVTSLINKKMRAIGKALGYGNISTYTARHSFATVQKRSGTSTSFISDALGHTNEKVTENYLDSFEEEAMIKNAEKLTAF